MQVIFGKLKQAKPSKIADKFQHIQSTCTVTVADYAPEDLNNWIKIDKSEFEKYCYTYNMWWKRGFSGVKVYRTINPGVTYQSQNINISDYLHVGPIERPQVPKRTISNFIPNIAHDYNPDPNFHVKIETPSIKAQTVLIVSCKTCKYQHDFECWFNPPPFPKVNDRIHCSHHTPT